MDMKSMAKAKFLYSNTSNRNCTSKARVQNMGCRYARKLGSDKKVSSEVTIAHSNLDVQQSKQLIKWVIAHYLLQNTCSETTFLQTGASFQAPHFSLPPTRTWLVRQKFGRRKREDPWCWDPDFTPSLKGFGSKNRSLVGFFLGANRPTNLFGTVVARAAV